MAERSLQQLLITNFSLGPSGYTGSRGDVGYVGSGGGSSAPTIATIGYVGDNTATDVAGGETVTLTGTGFVTGCSIIINGSPVGAVTFINSTQVTFVAPALAAGTYILYLVNSNGSTAISVPGISYSGVPSFYTGAGSVGTVYETSSFNSNVAAVGDSAITYSIASGLLPTGATLNANGVITGTSVLTGNATTYTFGVNASDGQNQDVTRTYTITVNPDSVTWSSPASGATVSLGQNSSSTTTLTATSAAGKAVTYTANALPTGLSIVGSAVTGTPTVLGNTTSILTANATSTTRSADITVTWNVAVANEPYFMYNSLLLSGNGSNNANNNAFVDSSTNNFTITRNGNTTQGTFTPYGANWSVTCTRSATAANETRIQVGATTGLGLASNNFCIEMWVYFTSSYTGDGPFCTNILTSFTTNTWWFGPHSVNSGRITVYDYNYSTSGPLMSESTSPPINQWVHYALVRNGNSFTIYRNGTSSATATFAGAFAGSSSGLMISKAGDVSGGNASFDGYLSNLRVVNGSSVYTSNFTPPTSPLTAITNTGLLTLQSNRFIDNSTNAASITISQGTPSIQRFSPFSLSAAYSASTVGGSAYFDGSGDYLSLPVTSSAFTFDGAFTIEAWVYRTGSYMTLIDTRSGGNYTDYVISLNASGQVDFVVVGGSGVRITTTETVISNQWAHIACVRQGSTVRVYINGVASVNTVTYASTMTPASSVGWIGTTKDPLSSTGYMSNLRIVKGTAVYTATFTPPSAPMTAIAGTSLLCDFTNAGIIDNTMINNLETVGNAQISTAQSKFGGSSMAFDGNGDYVVQPTNINFGYGTGDFTIEFWLYLNTTSADQTMVSNLTSDTSVNPHIYYGNGLGIRYYTGGANRIIGSALSTSTWYHIAVSRASGSTKMFINGTQTGSTYTDSNNYGTTAPLGIATYWVSGSPGTVSTLNGYLDDLRITKGYARYTANFTPPTSALLTK